ncbi:hypothetical protein [Streptomyces phaeochromogenes]
MAGIRTSTVLHRDGIGALVKALSARGRTVIGPTVRDGAVVLTELASADQLSYDWGDRTGDGHLSVVEERPVRPSYAFRCVRPCDLRAVAIQERVLTGGPLPGQRLSGALSGCVPDSRRVPRAGHYLLLARLRPREHEARQEQRETKQ